MRIGYARVSTRDQNLEMQFDAPAKAACWRIFTDKLSGALDDRPGLKEALSHLREGDTLVVWKLDRLGRSVKGLVDLVNELEARKVHFQRVTDGIDTRTPHGRFFFHMMASLAQMERELIMERTRAGLEAARSQGRVGGRKRQMTDSKASGTPPREVAHSLHVSVPTLYRWVPASSRIICPQSPERSPDWLTRTPVISGRGHALEPAPGQHGSSYALGIGLQPD